MSTRFTGLDRPRIVVTVDPEWLLAPLFVRAAAGIDAYGPELPGPLTEAVPTKAVPAGDNTPAGWADWWRAAVAYAPGTPPPRQQDLLAFSPALTELWAGLRDRFDGWLSGRPQAARHIQRENAILAELPQAPARTVQVLQIPVSGEYLLAADTDRVVVTPTGRETEGYVQVLASMLRAR